MHKAASGDCPAWIDLGALRFMTQLRQASKASVSANCLAATLVAQYEWLEGGPALLQDHVRKLLVAALRVSPFSAARSVHSSLAMTHAPLAQTSPPLGLRHPCATLPGLCPASHHPTACRLLLKVHHQPG